MAKPFRFRHVNEIAGTFVLAGLGLLVVTVVLMGRAQHWFTTTRLLTLRLPPEGTGGLKAGDDVRYLGAVVGSVRAIYPDPDGSMMARVSIQSDVAGFVSQDSKVYIRQQALGIGDPFIEVTRATGPPLEAGQTKQVEPPDPRMEQTIVQIRDEAVPAIQDLRRALDEYQRLAADLRSPSGNLQQALAHANHIAGSVERGDGLAGKVLSDPQMADQVTKLLPKLNASLDEVQAAVADLRKATAGLPAMTESANEEMKKVPALVEQTQRTLQQIEAVMRDIQKTTAALPETAKSVNQTAEALPGLVIQMQETMRQIQRLVEGIQRSWLVRGSMTPEDAGGRIRPDQVDVGGK